MVVRKFRTGNYSLNDEPHSGRSVALVGDVLQTQEEQNLINTNQKSPKLRFGHSSIYQHVCVNRKVKKNGPMGFSQIAPV